MVSPEEIRDFMKSRAEEDRQTRSVQVTAKSLEEALREASVELNIPVSRLEFDTLQKGKNGVLGYGSRDWMIIAYETRKAQEQNLKTVEEALEEAVVEVEEVEVDMDGQVFVRLFSDGAYLKVLPPKGKGHPATVDQAVAALHDRAVRDINKQVINGTVKLATATYARVGDFIHNPVADAYMTVEVEDYDMKAFLNLHKPGPGGSDLSQEDIEGFLRNNGIVHGVQPDVLSRIVDSPVYDERILIAMGTKPAHGKDAKIQFFFDTSVKIKPQEVDGRVDFKSLNTVHNVFKGELLAKKEPAEKGENGRTVLGKIIPARDGKDLNFDLGNNVELSKDKLKVSSTADGQVLLINGKISVETVMVIPGDVGTATGDIQSFGSVVVKGNVDDGFSIKAAGNIEVMGNVGKSFLETPADVIVHQGINGNGGGQVKAGQNVWSKFIQNGTVDAGNFIITSDGIVHSNVTAERKILCRGKRAKIIGGHIRAAEEINAATLGALGVGETVLEVGSDPKVKAELVELLENKTQQENELNEVLLNLQGLQKLINIRKKLSPEKMAVFTEQKDKAQALQKELARMGELIQKKQDYLDSLQLMGRVSVSGTVFAGVRVIIKDVEMEVTRDYNSKTFVRDGAAIKLAPYQEITDEIDRRA